MKPILFLVGSVALHACNRTPAGAPTHEIPELGISIPQPPGWVVDSTVRLDNEDAGGLALRLLRENAAPMAPRIDVIIEPRRPRPAELDEFLKQNLRDMAKYEKDGDLRILDVNQRPVNVGPRRGYRVQHEYAMASQDGDLPLSITQVSTLFLLDGRGITVTAPGLTELFRPLADSIDSIMSGISVGIPAGGGRLAVPAQPKKVTELPDDVQLIDLGKVGGTQ
jgi:hypothetical protein